MKVAEYVKKGLKNFVEAEAEGNQGSCTEGCHRVTVFVKKENGKIVDCKFNATKRCKKLLAITDYMCELVKEKGSVPTKEELLSMFPEEKEKDKMENRAEIALRALKEALS
ncbi:nicotinate phosphoribosyltransferase [Hydrogenivirga sp.]